MNPSTNGSSKFDSTRLILIPLASNSIAARPSAASRQSNPSLNSQGTIMSLIGCSSSTSKTRGSSALGRVLARVPVSSLTELINALNLSRGIFYHALATGVSPSNQTRWVLNCHHLLFMARSNICCNRATSLRHRFR